MVGRAAHHVRPSVPAQKRRSQGVATIGPGTWALGASVARLMQEMGVAGGGAASAVQEGGPDRRGVLVEDVRHCQRGGAVSQLVSAHTKGSRLQIVGTGIGIIGTVIGTGLVLAGLMSAQLASVSAQVAAVNTRIDDLIARTTAEHADIRAEIRRLDDRLRAVKPAPPAE